MLTLQLHRLSRQPSVMQSLTGWSWAKFQGLIPAFDKALWTLKCQQPGRQRVPGAGNKGVLDTAGKKLFFTLFYLKVYPTFRVLGFLFGKPFGKLVAELRRYRQALEQARSYKIALPERRLQTGEEFFTKFPQTTPLLVDAPQRPLRRPADTKRQRHHDRGQKNGTPASRGCSRMNTAESWLLRPPNPVAGTINACSIRVADGRLFRLTAC